ncbi:MAG: hypothetical protein ACRDHP_09585, partial [Ktedonobacterales bacterium]
LHWAETETLRGDEAFLALCAARGAQIQPLSADGRAERNVSLPVSRLLYMALAQREGRSSPGTRPLSPAPSVTSAPAMPPTPAAPAPARDVESASPLSPTATQAPQPVARSAPAPQVSGPLMPPLMSDARLADALAELSAQLPTPNVAALLKTDGSILAHAERDTTELPAGAYTHLATATLATARALLVADLGTLDELRITTSNHLILLRRLAHAERTALLALVLPPDTGYQVALAAIQAHTSAILDATLR